MLEAFLKGIKTEQMNYKGIIYAGIMVTEQGPKVLEFNVRFGDPETQAVLMRLKSDLSEVMMKTAEGKLNEVNLEWTDEPAVCVVMASGGYPSSYEKGYEISGIEAAEKTGAVVFHAGTGFDNDKIVNTGGRVLGVTALGDNLENAVSKAYKAVECITWKDAWYRKDIAQKAFKH